VREKLMIPDRECINQALYIIDYEVFMPRCCDFAILAFSLEWGLPTPDSLDGSRIDVGKSSLQFEERAFQDRIGN
jgi:hypothetical protein